MVKITHSIGGLLFILLGGFVLSSQLWPIHYWWIGYLATNNILVIAGALIGFGAREILLEFSTVKRPSTKEHQ